MERVMGERVSKRAGSLILASCLAVVLTACASADGGAVPSPADSAGIPSDARDDDAVRRVGICGPVDDDPWDRIAQGIRARLDEIGTERDVVFEISEISDRRDEGQALDQTVADLPAGDVDLMIGVTTPTAAAIRDAAAGSGIPMLFAAVPDPEGTGLAASDGIPTGTSDRLDAAAVMELIFAADPEASRIGILYDGGRSSSAASVMGAVSWLTGRGVEIVERTGSTEDEIVLAARALVGDGVDAVFTPIDDTVLRAMPAVCGIFAEAGIPHYGGADAFARKGAFLGYGVDYTDLGVATADMAAEILLDGADPAEIPVRILDGTTAVINAGTCEALGWDLETVRAALGPLCPELETIVTDEVPADPRDEIPADLQGG